METIILYGKHGYITNIIYNGICDKIKQFANESGKDPYNRAFDAEPLIDFAIKYQITNLSIDEIYRRYIYYKLDTFDKFICKEWLQRLEMEEILETFKLF